MPDLSRRAALLAAGALVAAAPETLAWDFRMPSIDGGTLDLATHRGKVLLVVNTASFCGYTYQYGALEKLHAELGPQGLVVVGMPSQDFEQESGSNAEVKKFCELTYGVRFPMAGLSHVRGGNAEPFYAWVKATRQWEPRWNFHKVLIGRDGRIAGLFTSDDEPTGPKLLGAIRTALALPVS